jgi:hypothetical protein
MSLAVVPDFAAVFDASALVMEPASLVSVVVVVRLKPAAPTRSIDERVSAS